MPTSKAPNEKLAELLFTTYLFQMVQENGYKRPLLYSPSTREEYLQGYDTEIHRRN